MKFIKNYFYNRTSIIKLLHLYSFLKESTFQNELAERIRNCEFKKLKSNDLIFFNEVFENFSKEKKNIEYNFGYVWFFQSNISYYFKDDFSFDEFFFHFSNLKKNFNIEWNCIEFFDKNIKILEIFKKNAFLRDFRNEIISNEKIKKKTISIIPIDFAKNDYLFFLLKYEPNRVRLVVHFYDV